MKKFRLEQKKQSEDWCVFSIRVKCGLVGWETLTDGEEKRDHKLVRAQMIVN